MATIRDMLCSINLLRRAASIGSEVSAKSVADDAAALLDDAKAGRLDECAAVASLGGRDRSQCRRDFNQLLSKLDYGIEPIFPTVTVQDLLKLEALELDLPMYAPHELVGAIYRGGWEMFSDVFFCGAPEGFSSTSNPLAPKTLSPEAWCMHRPLPNPTVPNVACETHSIACTCEPSHTPTLLGR
jgi:hypothetical protein